MIECVHNYSWPYAMKWIKLAMELLYEHVLKSVETGHEDNVIILWNQQVKTGRTILNNKPDIMISDNEKEHAC
jgi:hypothetical protein